MDTSKAITHISLCAGYGGIDIGLKRCMPTLRTILVSEIEAYAVANLVAKMEAGELDPCPIWTDLKTLPLDSIPENISILSGGFPCQPFSQAGKREGDEDPRHLFPYIKNAIRTIQPQWVFLENVEGIISAKLKGDGWEDPAGTPVLLHVIRELERVGYRPTAGVFSAAEVGATHQRKRVFILAHSKGAGLEGHFGVQVGCGEPRRNSSQPKGSVGWSDSVGTLWPARPSESQHEWEEPRVVGDADCLGSRETSRPEQQAERASVSGERVVGDANSGRQLQSERGEQALRGRDSNPSAELGDAEGRQIHGGKSGELGEAAQRGESESTTVADPSAERGVVADPNGSGREKPELQHADISSEPSAELADAEGDDEQGCGSRPGQGQSRGEGAEQRDETESQLGGTVNGATSGVDPTANRVDRLRLLGNGVVPDTAEVAFRTLYKELMDEQQSNQS